MTILRGTHYTYILLSMNNLQSTIQFLDEDLIHMLK